MYGNRLVATSAHFPAIEIDVGDTPNQEVLNRVPKIRFVSGYYEPHVLRLVVVVSTLR